MSLKSYFKVVVWSALIILLIYQTLILTPIVSAKNELENGMIADIEIFEKKKSQIESRLISQVKKWKEHDIEVEGSTAKLSIPSELIHFDVSKTVENYIKVTSTPWYNFWGTGKKIQIPLELSIDEKVHELLKEAPMFYVDETVEAIQEHAGFLMDGAVQAEEVPLSIDDMERVSFEIQDVVIEPTGISSIVHALNETTLVNGEQFSFLKKLKEVNSSYNEETANFVASTLYSTVLQSELDIKERHSQNKLTKYLQPGIEVKVNQNRNQDFSFVNETGRPIRITASLQGSQLTVEIYSLKSAYKATYDLRKKEVIQPRTIYRLTPTLAAGRESVLEQGKTGMRVQVYKIITETGGSFQEEVLISQDFYPPEHKVVLVSSLEPPSIVTTSDDRAEEQEISKQALPSGEKDPVNNHVAKDEDAGKGEGDVKSEEKQYDKGGNLIQSN